MDEQMWLKVIAPYANFILFVVLAVYWLRKPLANFFHGKKQDFIAQAEEAAKAKELALAENNDLKSQLNKIRQEVEDIKTKAKKSSDQEAARLVAKAEELAADLKQDATRVRENEVKKAKEQLRRHLVGEVKKAVEGRLETDLPAAARAKLVDSHINALKAIEGGRA